MCTILAHFRSVIRFRPFWVLFTPALALGLLSTAAPVFAEKMGEISDRCLAQKLGQFDQAYYGQNFVDMIRVLKKNEQFSAIDQFHTQLANEVLEGAVASDPITITKSKDGSEQISLQLSTLKTIFTKAEDDARLERWCKKYNSKNSDFCIKYYPRGLEQYKRDIFDPKAAEIQSMAAKYLEDPKYDGKADAARIDFKNLPSETQTLGKYGWRHKLAFSFIGGGDLGLAGPVVDESTGRIKGGILRVGIVGSSVVNQFFISKEQLLNISMEDSPLMYPGITEKEWNCRQAEKYGPLKFEGKSLC